MKTVDKIHQAIMARWLCALLMGAMAAACSDDGGNGEAALRELWLTAGVQQYQETEAQATRSGLPPGFVAYDAMAQENNVSSMKIRIYMTHDRSIDYQGDFAYASGAGWTGKVPLDEGDYHVYGFMPSAMASRVALTPHGSSYADGAVVTLERLNALMANDACIIVGVKGHGDGTTPMSALDISQGAFGYNASTDGNHIYLLVDHLFAAMQLKMKIDAEYGQLRTIKLTRLQVHALQMNTVKVTATLAANTTGASPLSMTVENTNESGPSEWETLYEGEEQTLDETSTLDFLTYYAPMAGNTQFEMRTKYNVYDSKGNLIRKDCEVINKLTMQKPLTHGQRYTFYLTVNPTYLGVLSEPDLDNPGITIND